MGRRYTSTRWLQGAGLDPLDENPAINAYLNARKYFKTDLRYAKHLYSRATKLLEREIEATENASKKLKLLEMLLQSYRSLCVDAFIPEGSGYIQGESWDFPRLVMFRAIDPPHSWTYYINKVSETEGKSETLPDATSEASFIEAVV